MTLKYRQDHAQQISLEAARTALNQFAKGWKGMIDDCSMAIKEINALDDNSKSKIELMMRSTIKQYLPNDPDAPAIVRGILQLSEEPYVSYLKEISTDWCFESGNTVVNKFHDRYRVELSEFIKSEVKKSKLGYYFFQITELDLTISKATATSFNADWHHEFQSQVKLFSTGSIELVEEDAIGLQSFASEVSSRLKPHEEAILIKDGSGIYLSNYANPYGGTNHAPCIKELKGIILASGSKAKRS